MPRAKLSGAEKERRKHERKAKALTDAAAKSYGPLFAHLAPTFTRDDAYWHWRGIKAAVAEESHYGVCLHAWGRFQLACVHAAAARLLGIGAAEKIAASLDKYPQSYRRAYWRDALAGVGRQVLRLERRTDPARVNEWNREGVYLVEAEVWPPAGYVPVMTADEFDRRFPAWEHGDPRTGAVDYPEPDDGGLFGRVMNSLQRAA